MERGIIGERTRATLQHKRAKGEKTGGDVPFGYDVDNTGHLFKNEAKQKAIRLIHRLRLKGYSLRAVCRELEKEGHKTKRGNKTWHPQTHITDIKSGGHYETIPSVDDVLSADGFHGRICLCR